MCQVRLELESLEFADIDERRSSRGFGNEEGFLYSQSPSCIHEPHLGISDAIQYARNDLDSNTLGIDGRNEVVNHPKARGTVRTTQTRPKTSNTESSSARQSLSSTVTSRKHCNTFILLRPMHSLLRLN